MNAPSLGKIALISANVKYLAICSRSETEVDIVVYGTLGLIKKDLFEFYCRVMDFINDITANQLISKFTINKDH